MSYKCRAYSRWWGSAEDVSSRAAFYAGYNIAIERAIELLADKHGLRIEAAELVKEIRSGTGTETSLAAEQGAGVAMAAAV